MRCSYSLKRVLIALCAATASLSQVDDTLAQVGVLNPNPTMPSDVPLGSGAYGNSSGIGIGRGPTPPGQAREKNPAAAMLKSLEGTNYGRYTGRVVFPPGAASSEMSPPRRSGQSPPEATRSARRTRSTALLPVGGRPENRWRYRFSQGRWWYLTDANRWSYFDGGRWVPYQQDRSGISSARPLRTSRERRRAANSPAR